MWEEYPRAQGHRLLDDFAESSKPIVQKDVLFGKQIGVFVPEKRRRNWGLLLDRCGDRKALGQAYAARRYKQDVQQDVSRRLPVGHPNAEVERPDSHFRSSIAGASHKWPNHTTRTHVAEKIFIRDFYDETSRNASNGAYRLASRCRSWSE